MRILTLLVAVTLSAGLAGAQSLGEVARRERERRAALGQRARVFSNEDLARPRILEPASRAGIGNLKEEEAQPAAGAASFAPAVPAPGPGVPLWKVAEQPGFSLGEYARRLREQRAAWSAGPAAAPQVAESPPAPPPFISPLQPAAGFSLAEYARRLEAERRQHPPAPTPPNNFESVSTRDPIRVRRGDSLWKLSFVYLGDGKLWSSLWKANPEIRNPDLIYPEQLLRWPDASLLARNAERSAQKTNLSAKALHHQNTKTQTVAEMGPDFSPAKNLRSPEGAEDLSPGPEPTAPETFLANRARGERK